MDLELRMGLDEKLKNAEARVGGTLSYAIDSHNMYIDALLVDKTTIERQLVDSNRSYGLKYPDGKVYMLNHMGESLGANSLALGLGNKAESDNQLVIGKYNELSTDLFVIGNGEADDKRANVFTVSLEGNVFASGNLNCKKLIADMLIAGASTISSLDVKSDIKVTDGNIIVEKGDISVVNGTFSGDVSAANGNFSGTLKVNDKEVATSESVNTSIESAKTELGKDIDALEQSVETMISTIVTDVWYRGSTPPTNSKLLWVRYDGTNTYGNGVLYYFNPGVTNPSADQIANVENWIMMSAAYT